MKLINFTSDGYKLAGNLFIPPVQPKKVAFLLIQGWAGHQNISAAQRLAEAGYTAMTYDMRGNGESEGDMAQFSRANFLQDSTSAYDYLKEQVSLDTSIAVVGSSFGSYTAILLSQDRKVIAMSFRVPANYPDEGFELAQMTQKAASGDFAAWRRKKLHYTQNRALSALHEFKGQIQIIRSEADELVPQEVSENYAAAINDPSKLRYDVMIGAPHNLSDEKLQAEYEELLMNWVNSTANILSL